MIPVPRLSAVTETRFKEDFLKPNRPVVIVDGLINSPSTRAWNIDYFNRRFGDLPVALSRDFFFPTDVARLSEFLDMCRDLERLDAEHALAEGPPLYLRLADPGFGGVDFTSILFDELSSEWRRPYFLPGGAYFSPFVLRQCEPNQRRFPEWGLFISPRGGLTSIHIDRTNDNAVLAVTSGRKVGYLLEPTRPLLEMLKSEHLEREADDRPSSLERLSAVLSGRTPDYFGLSPHYFELGPGEVLFIPKRWAHEVFTVSACVSFTYNFVHMCDVDLRYLMHRILGRGVH